LAPEIVTSDKRFDLRAKGPVTGEDELEREVLPFQASGGFEQEKLTLLLGQTTDTQQAWRIREVRGIDI
jgi:hypothetical protein